LPIFRKSFKLFPIRKFKFVIVVLHIKSSPFMLLECIEDSAGFWWFVDCSLREDFYSFVCEYEIEQIFNIGIDFSQLLVGMLELIKFFYVTTQPLNVVFLDLSFGGPMRNGNRSYKQRNRLIDIFELISGHILARKQSQKRANRVDELSSVDRFESIFADHYDKLSLRSVAEAYIQDKTYHHHLHLTPSIFVTR
jgi:hypothetical protein